MTQLHYNALASKSDVVEIKQELTDLKELVQGLIVASDSLAKSRHDRWIKQIAEKVGLHLKVE